MSQKPILDYKMSLNSFLTILHLRMKQSLSTQLSLHRFVSCSIHLQVGPTGNSYSMRNHLFHVFSWLSIHTILAISIYPSIKYHIWSKSELNLANYMNFAIFIEFVSDLDQPGTCSFIRLEMTAE